MRHALPKGEMTHRGRPVDPARIRNAALLTIERRARRHFRRRPDRAAHRLCVNIPPEHKAHYLQLGVGHYGVFNGSRFRAETAPRIADFILSNNSRRSRATAGGQARGRFVVAEIGDSANLSRGFGMINR